MHALLMLLPQLAIVLTAARLLGWLFRRLHQPQVMGEMVAGILLGPSLLGWVAPGMYHLLFPAESLETLQILSQVGLILFMFLVGLELDPALLKGKSHAAVLTSHASITAPFLLGTILALYLYPRLSDAGVSFSSFALFMGAAMSVTAFPVLARILTERNLLSTRVGAITITCAAVDDVTAWCILAAVIALVRSTGPESALITLAGTIAYILIMLFAVRPVMGKLETYYQTRGNLTQSVLAILLLLLLASSWTTEKLGIHALFGAFIVGVILPKEKSFVREVTGKLEDVTVILFLPLFFAYTGLRTQIGLLGEAELWLDCLLIILVAVAGKFGGSTLAARTTGLTWRQSGALGILMNTRGLMELVILTIGLELGVISPIVFAMMVIMALVTTFMTTPILEWIYPARMIRTEALGTEMYRKVTTILLPVSLPTSGLELLRVARSLASPEDLRVYALHLMRPERVFASSYLETEPAEQEPLRALIEQAEGITIRPMAFVSRDVGADITSVAHEKNADLVLMGWHKPVVSQSILSGTVYEVIQKTRADVAVYLARQFRPWKRILVPFSGGIHDLGALEIARRISHHSGARVTILHVIQPGRDPDDPGIGLSAAAEEFENGQVRLKVIESNDPPEAAVEEARVGYDLVVIGASPIWGLEPVLFSGRHERLAQATPVSLLVLRKYAPQTLPATKPESSRMELHQAGI